MTNLRTQHVNDWLELTYSKNEKERAHAVGALCPCHVRYNDDAVWDRVLELADDPSSRVRSAVLHTLHDGSPNARVDDVVEAVEKMQHDSDLKLRRRVRNLLAHYRRTGRINVA